MHKQPYVFIENVRSEEMKKQWQQIINDGVDPFDPEYFMKYHPYPIILESDHWIATKNAHPYEGAKRHLLFITKVFYDQKFSNIPGEVLSDLYVLADQVTEKLGITGGTLWTRFGDPKISLSTVYHFHAQLIEPLEGFPFSGWYGQKNNNAK